MSARFRRSRAFAFFLPLAFTPAASAPLTSASASESALAREHADEPLCTCDDTCASTPNDAHAAGVERIVALADARGIPLAAPVRATLDEAGELLALLPLERLVDVCAARGRLELVFDTGAADVLEVCVPERRALALDGDDEEDVLVHGRPVSVKSEARTLLVHRRLRFELGDDGIRGLVPGDIEVAAGPFHFDLSVHIERGAPRAARDRFGRSVLALDATGAPYKVGGRWVLQHHDEWLVLSAMGHVLQVGLGAPRP
jgi:hypothetical protein